jgi:hypothetical protein
MGANCMKNITLSNNDVILHVKQTTGVPDPDPVTDDVLQTAGLALGMLHAKGTKEEMTALANDYASVVGMNDANRKLLVTLKTCTNEEFIKAAFTDPNDSKKQLSYAEMRGLYG